MSRTSRISRRRLLQALCAVGLTGGWPGLSARPELILKPIPASGEKIPVIGLGSSRTFNVGDDTRLRNQCAEVMRRFLDSGGTMIDSSPMYGTSQDVIGYGLDRIGMTDRAFSADKVWISDVARGSSQMEASRRLWRVPRFDLMQVHNLVSWEEHLETLYRMKQDGEIRYVGITTSHGRRHDDFAAVMRDRPLDFVQLSYNLLDREVERELLPLARDRGIAVIVNRPFQRGHLIDRLERHPLPAWASDIGISNWPQYLLKFAVSHPAVTVAIPATSNVEHVLENMGACRGVLPDSAQRQRMIAYVESL